MTTVKKTAAKKTTSRAPRRRTVTATLAAAPAAIDATVTADMRFESATTAPASPAARVPLFTVDGVVYSMPAEPTAGDAIRLLRDIRKHGMTTAADMLLSRLIGDEGVEALLSSKGFDTDRWNKVTAAASTHVFGALENTGPKAAS